MEMVKKIAIVAWGDRHRILRYVISGLSATSVNIFVIYVATDLLGIWYIMSSVIAFTLGVCVSFCLQKFWTFKNDSVVHIRRQMVLYFVLALFAISLNAIIVYVEVQFLGIQYVLAQIISSAILACINFFIYKKIIFIIQS